jgi:excisionase family DNA binding protein
MTNRFLKPEEVAELLGFKVKTVYNWVCQGRIPHCKIGGRPRFEEAAIREWARQFAVPAGEMTNTGRD